MKSPGHWGTRTAADQTAAFAWPELIMIEEPSKKFAAHGERDAKLTKTDGHSLVAQSLKSLGVTHVYNIAGTPTKEAFSSALSSVSGRLACGTNTLAC